MVRPLAADQQRRDEADAPGGPYLPDFRGHPRPRDAGRAKPALWVLGVGPRPDKIRCIISSQAGPGAEGSGSHGSEVPMCILTRPPAVC